MTSIDATVSMPADYLRTERSGSQLSRMVIGLLAVPLCTAAVLAAMHAQQSVIVAGLVLGLPLLYAMFVWPETVVLASIFILYANVAVVAVRFHGVPHAIGMIGPAMPLVTLLLYQLVIRGHKLVFTPTFPFVVAYLAILLISSLFSQYPGVAKDELAVFVSEGMCLYLVLVNLIRTPQMIRRVTWVLLLSGSAMGGLSVFQQVTDTHDNNYGGFAQTPEDSVGFGVQTETGVMRQKKASGPIGEQNRYAQIMLMLVPLGLFRYWSEPAGTRRIVAGLATALIAAGCALTFSRGAAVGFALMMILMTVMRYIKVHQLVVLSLAVVLLIVAMPQLRTRLATLQNVIGVRVPGLPKPDLEIDGAISGRMTSMLSAARVAADYPLLGVGPGNFRFLNREYGKTGGFRGQEGNRYAHCLYLEIAAESGILGLICFLAIVGVTLQELARARRRWSHDRPDLANMATGYLLAIVAYMTSGIFLHMTYERYFWLMLAVASATAYVANRLASDLDVGDSDTPRFATTVASTTPATMLIKRTESRP